MNYDLKFFRTDKQAAQDRKARRVAALGWVLVLLVIAAIIWVALSGDPLILGATP